MYHVIKPPPPELAHIVKGFWSFEFADPASQIQISTFVNDSSGLTFVLDRNNPLYRATIDGQQTKPKAFSPISSINAFGVVFQNGVIPEIFGCGATEFTDTEIHLDDVTGFNLSEAVIEAGSFDSRIAIISKMLVRLSSRKFKEDDLIRNCLAKISANQLSRVSQILKEYKISERQFERKFATAVGVTPRHYLKVMRFQRALQLLRTSPQVNLTELAMHLDYFDQAHFVKDVKQLSGYTPGQLHKKLFRLGVNQKGTSSYLVDLTKNDQQSLPMADRTNREFQRSVAA